MKKILAVDDQKEILYTLKAIAEVAKFEIVTCNNGVKALETLGKRNFDLVLVDYYMPEMNGIELVKKIRTINSKIPILVLTVDESLDTAKKFLESGATDFATKPIRAADLISRIKLHLELSDLKVSSFTGDIREQMPKGMSSQTMQRIMDYLEKLKNPETIESISLGTGLAYQTVHRYLIFFEETGFVMAELVYGKVGRPIKRYKKITGEK